MNPARSIGPALFSGELQYLSLYIAAPIVGMLLATLFCKLTQAKAA
jgi:aquaporin NIP